MSFGLSAPSPSVEGSFTKWTKIYSITSGQPWTGFCNLGYVDNQGNVYVIDRNTNALFTIDPQGNITNTGILGTVANAGIPVAPMPVMSILSSYVMIQDEPTTNKLYIFFHAKLLQTIISPFVSIHGINNISPSGKYILICDTNSPFNLELYGGS